MKPSTSVLMLVALVLVTTIPAVSADLPQPAKAARIGLVPRTHLGPQAKLANVLKPNYLLFTCQVGLSSVTCYDPYQIRHAYNIDSVINAGYTGKGKTIVIIDAFQSPNITTELSFFSSFYGLPGLNGLGNPDDPNLGTFTQIAPDGLTTFDPANPTMIGWAVEISLDVEWAHAIAPGASIVLVLAKSNADVDLFSATQYAVDHHLGDIITQSFGEDESCVDATLLAAEHKLFAEATRRHITLVAASGDEGAAQPSCDNTSWLRAVSSPASDPLVLGIGGTELHAAGYCFVVLGCDPTANPAPGTYEGEVAWDEPSPGGDGATGGGFSVIYKKPFYQFGVLPFYRRHRGVPDVAYSAAGGDAVLIFVDIPGLPVSFYTVGGTSVGTPEWGAIIALADQKAGRSLGFVNGSLYLFSLFPRLYSAMFHDITSGNNSVTELDASNSPVFVEGFDAGRGWDPLTGLGSPKADAIISFLTFFRSDHDAEDVAENSDPEWNGRLGDHEMRPR